MGIDKLQFLNEAFLIFQKDVLQEFKTRYAVNAILLFAVVTLVSVSFSIGTFSASAEIKSALYRRYSQTRCLAN
jgi:heme exporter protein B